MGCRCQSQWQTQNRQNREKSFSAFSTFIVTRWTLRCGTQSQGSPFSTTSSAGGKNPNLVKNEASLAHLDLVKVPGVAPWPWQFAPRAEGPWPRCQDGLWGAGDKPRQNGGSSSAINISFIAAPNIANIGIFCACVHNKSLKSQIKVECRFSLGYLSLSHSYCQATRSLITSFLQVQYQMFWYIFCVIMIIGWLQKKKLCMHLLIIIFLRLSPVWMSSFVKGSSSRFALH